VRDALAELGLEWEVMPNKNDIMVLSPGVNKAAGLRAALDMLHLSFQETVGVGDAENDCDFLSLCGYSVAVANALPELKAQVHHVTQHEYGAGVVELIDMLLASAARG
jgi:hypothetical protein